MSADYGYWYRSEISSKLTKEHRAFLNVDATGSTIFIKDTHAFDPDRDSKPVVYVAVIVITNPDNVQATLCGAEDGEKYHAAVRNVVQDVFRDTANLTIDMESFA